MRKLLILIVILFFGCVSFAQKKMGQARIDSLQNVSKVMKPDSLQVNILLDIAISYISVAQKKAYNYGNHALILSKKLKWNEGIAKSLYSIAMIHYYDGNYKTSIRYINQSLKYTKNPVQMVTSMILAGESYYKLANYIKALEVINKSILICKEKNLKKSEIDCYVTLGNIQNGLKEYDKAINNYLKASEVAKSINEDGTLYICYVNIGGAYAELKRFNTAISFNQKALNLSIKNKNYLDVSDVYYHMGKNYNSKKDFEKALINFKRALKINTDQKDNFNTPYCNAGIGESYFGLKNFKLAKLYLNKAVDSNIKNNTDLALESNYTILGKIFLEESLNNADVNLLKQAENYFYKSIEIDNKINLIPKKLENYKFLGKTQYLLGKYKDAYELQAKQILLKDSLYNLKNKETIKNLEDKREIMLRDKQIQINKITIEAKEKQKWFLLSGMALLAIIGSLLFYRNKNRKKTNQKLQILNANLDHANKTKTQLLNILNHDLRSPVNSFIHYIQFQNESPDTLDQETKSRIEKATLSSAKNLLNSMEDILTWTKDQMANFEPQLKNVAIDSLFNDTKKHFLNEENIKIIFENPENLHLNTDENYLKTIIRNLTGNAIKALKETQNPKIIWKAWQENGQHYLSVQDNGPGADQEQFKVLYDEKEVAGIESGLGLHLIRDLAKAINCSIEVTTILNEGTTFKLIL